MGPRNQGHVRYPFYNASKNETMKKERKEGKPHGKKNPLKYNASKKKKERKLVAKKLCPSL
jgi:hypothetical protein